MTKTDWYFLDAGKGVINFNIAKEKLRHELPAKIIRESEKRMIRNPLSTNVGYARYRMIQQVLSELYARRKRKEHD